MRRLPHSTFIELNPSLNREAADAAPAETLQREEADVGAGAGGSSAAPVAGCCTAPPSTVASTTTTAEEAAAAGGGGEGGAGGVASVQAALASVEFGLGCCVC